MKLLMKAYDALVKYNDKETSKLLFQFVGKTTSKPLVIK